MDINYLICHVDDDGLRLRESRQRRSPTFST